MKSFGFFGLVLLFVGLSLGAARHDAPTFDEPLHLASGYEYLRTGNFSIDNGLSPITKMIEALPWLWLLDVPSAFSSSGYSPFTIADALLYHSSVSSQRLLLWGRLMNIFLGVLLGGLIYYWGRVSLGPVQGLLAAAAYFLNPVVLAHAHLATSDIGFTLFFTSTLYLLWRMRQDSSGFWAVAAGVSLAVCVISKFSSVILFPPVVFYLWNVPARRQVLFGAAFLTVVLLLIQIISWQTYWNGFAQLHKLLLAGGRGTFFLGSLGTEGSWYYFIVAFLLKTPVPFILLAAAGLFTLRSSALSDFLKRWIVLPVVAFGVMASFSHLQAGIRHLLPVYPLLALAVGEAIVRFWNSGRPYGRAVILAMGLWSLAIPLAAYPHYIAYFNEGIGGSRQGIHYLGDSNLDWGQELKSLGDYLQKHRLNDIYLSYFGNADPTAYGIRYKSVASVRGVNRREDPSINPGLQPRMIFAVSATNLQGFYAMDPQALAWLQARQPLAVLGHSMYVYDLTKDADAHDHLAKIFKAFGMGEDARFEEGLANKIRSQGSGTGLK